MPLHSGLNFLPNLLQQFLALPGGRLGLCHNNVVSDIIVTSDLPLRQVGLDPIAGCMPSAYTPHRDIITLNLSMINCLDFHHRIYQFASRVTPLVKIARAPLAGKYRCPATATWKRGWHLALPTVQEGKSFGGQKKWWPKHQPFVFTILRHK